MSELRRLLLTIVAVAIAAVAVGVTVEIVLPTPIRAASEQVAPVAPVAPVATQDARWNAFLYAVLLRHETECPTPRTAQFRSARKALMSAIASQVDPAYFVEVGRQLDDPKYMTATRGLLCRMATESITAVMRQMYE